MSTEHIKRPSSFASSRRFLIWGSVLVSIVAAGAIVVMLNYLATQHYERRHLASDHPFELSPLSIQIAARLTNRLDVVVLFSDEDETKSALHGMTMSLLREYSAVSDHIYVRSVDYIRDPGDAELIRGKYGLAISGAKNLIAFDYGGRKEIVGQEELSEYAAVGSERENQISFRRKAFRGEQLFTSAILSLTEASRQKVYFLQGHGEHDLASADPVEGYLQFGRLLHSNNLTVEVLEFGGTNTIPEDCSLLIVAGPRVPLQGGEERVIGEYLNRGGRMLCLLRSQYQTGLSGVLADWGIAIGRDSIVIDPPNGLQGPLHMAVRAFSESHPVVKPLMGSQLYLMSPRAVGKRPGLVPGPDQPEVETLFFTGASGSILPIINNEVATASGSPPQVVPLAAASQKGGVPGVSSSQGATRLLVVGESYFLGNNGIQGYMNYELANLAVNWLLDRDELVDIGPKPVRYYKLSMTSEKRKQLMWALLAIIPGSVLMLGVLVWLVRRK